MIEIKSIKEKFNDKWWSLLGHHFDESYIDQIYTQIMSDVKKGYKVLPSSNDIYQRFKLINPEDVRVVFITDEPICSYAQSLEWRNISSWIEKECFDGLNLNLEDNADYLIPQGVINLSFSLTVCNKSEHKISAWIPLISNIIQILAKSDNKVLFVSSTFDLSNITENIIKLEPGCFKQINEFMQKEYNTKIEW